MSAVLSARLTPNNYLLYGVVRLLAAVLLLSFATVSAYDLYLGGASKQPRVQATVINSEGHTLGGGTNSEETIYTPVLKYSVNGQTYTTSQGVQATSQPYSVGSKVEIQYDPSDPSHTFQPNMSRSRALLGLATVAALPGLALFVWTLKQMIFIRRAILASTN